MGLYSPWTLTAVVLIARICESGAEEGWWSDWSECTKPCGNGTQYRLKYCTEDKFVCGKLEGGCNMKPCYDPFESVEWSNCKARCGGGYRQRFIEDPPMGEEIMCNMQSCDPVIGMCKADVIFVLDSSAGQGTLGWIQLKQFVMDIVQGLKVHENHTRIGIISYSTFVRNDINLGEYFEISDILPLIWAVDYMAGLRNAAGAIEEMRNMFIQNKRNGVKQIAVVVTVDKSDLNQQFTIPNAMAAKDDGVDIFVVGFGEGDGEYAAIASDPAFHYGIANADTINGIATSINNISCERCDIIKCEEIWTECTVPCGVWGARSCLRHCVSYDCGDMLVIKEFEESCGQFVCFTPCQTTTQAGMYIAQTTTVPLDIDECYLCDFTKGQIWLPDRNNCHMFFVCEPIGYLKYRKHHMTCGELWWQQDIHTCVKSMPEDCDPDVQVVSYLPPSTTKVPCPYEPVPGQMGYFRSIDSPSEIQHCVQGMIFQDPPCECVQVGEITPTCSDALLLYFPYEDHYNDVTCHHAIATQYGNNVNIKNEPTRNGNVACFGGDTHFEVAFLRTWFAENNVDKFSIAVWFQHEGGFSTKAAIVNNGNCRQTAGFSVSCENSEIIGRVTINSAFILAAAQMADNQWHHAAYVYDVNTLKLYIDGVMATEYIISPGGFMQNNDVPMRIASSCDDDYFVGCLDELRVYSRVLSLEDINVLRNRP